MGDQIIQCTLWGTSVSKPIPQELFKLIVLAMASNLEGSDLDLGRILGKVLMRDVAAITANLGANSKYYCYDPSIQRGCGKGSPFRRLTTL